MKFSIAGKVYETESVDRLTLRHWMRIETETAELGRPMKWGQVRAMVERAQGLGAKVEEDDDFPWFIGIVIWASRFTAGESQISLAQAVDFPLSDLEFLQDEEPPLRTPGGGTRPRRPRPGSGRGESTAAAARRTTSRSATPSSGA
ncbi:hypothetical protein ACK8HX_02060 [Oryzobacter sp. R7]|uniref:hypothetical protein n=1 Tax=Oryzobacter faecalis TaxID=3388656 RepID=UPI00398C9D71